MTDPSVTRYINSQDHRQLALEAAEQGTVLLRNEDQILPTNLSRLSKVAVVGAGRRPELLQRLRGMEVLALADDAPVVDLLLLSVGVGPREDQIVLWHDVTVFLIRAQRLLEGLTEYFQLLLVAGDDLLLFVSLGLQVVVGVLDAQLPGLHD